VPISVKLFAGLRARHGDSLSLDLQPPLTVEELVSELKKKNCWIEGSRIALDQQFAKESDIVRSSSEIAVIPPVSGGNSRGNS